MDRQVYCKKCEEIVEMKMIERKATNTGKVYLQGSCSKCSEVLYDVPYEEEK